MNFQPGGVYTTPGFWTGNCTGMYLQDSHPLTTIMIMKPHMHIQQSMIPQELLEVLVPEMGIICMKNTVSLGKIMNNTVNTPVNSGAYEDT